MTQITEEERRAKFTAEWKGAPAAARKAAGLAWLCGLLWALRIPFNAYAQKGYIDGKMYVFALFVLVVFISNGYTAINRKRLQFVVLVLFTCVSLYGPALLMTIWAILFVQGKPTTGPWSLTYIILSIAELSAGIGLFACLFSPAVFRQVWTTPADPTPPEPPPPV